MRVNQSLALALALGALGGGMPSLGGGETQHQRDRAARSKDDISERQKRNEAKRARRAARNK